jgi:hypothetical protein
VVVAVVSTEEVLAVAVSTAEASVVALSTAVVVSTAVAFVVAVSAVVVSTAAAFVGDVLVGATSAITDSLMMCSSAALAFQGGGAGAIRTAITRMVTMDTVGTRTAIDTAGTVTTAAAVMDIAVAAAAVTDTATAVDQGTPGLRGAGDRLFEISPTCWCVAITTHIMSIPSDMACATNIATCHPRVWFKSGLMKSSTALVFYRR